jgi:hypothetical protein
LNPGGGEEWSKLILVDLTELSMELCRENDQFERWGPDGCYEPAPATWSSVFEL